MEKKFTLLFLFIILTCIVFFRSYDYKNISLDYDEASTIYIELENTSFNSISNYIFLRNLFDFKEINQAGHGIYWEINICFPLFYIFLKTASLIDQSIDFFRLVIILLGILTPFFLFLIGKKYSLRVGIIAAILMLFHPWAQHQASHIRFYEFWVLVSTFCLWYVELMITKINDNKTNPFHFLFLGIFILLPSTVHAFGVVSSVFLVCILLFHFYNNKETFIQISLRDKMIFGITFSVFSIIVAINIGVFAYARFIIDVTKQPAMSESTLHVLASILFNFGQFHISMIALLLLFIFLKKDFKNIKINAYLLSMAVSLSPVFLFILLKPQAFKPDYAYGIFTYLLLIVAISTEYVADELSKEKYKIALSGIVTLFLIVSTLPSFVSNVFIDHDRFDHIGVAKFISQIKDADFYSDNPGTLNTYLGKKIVRQIKDMEPEKCDSQKDEYFFVRMRKGKSSNFIYDFKNLKDAQLIGIIGKDRIDLRASKVYVFYRKCKASDTGDMN